MTIVVGYLPTAEGSAAVHHAMNEARLMSARLVMVNTGHYGDFSHPHFATAEDIHPRPTADGRRSRPRGAA